MTTLHRIIFIVFALTLLVSPVGLFVPSRAETGALTVVQADATPSFPTGIRFSLTARSEAAVSKASLIYSIGAHPTNYASITRFEPTTSPDVSLFVDLQLQGIPPGVALTYTWVVEGEDGFSSETQPARIEWIDARFAWDVLRSDDIELFSYSGHDDFNEQALATSQATLDAVQERFSAPPRHEPLRIWLYNSQSDMAGALSPNSREWIGGVSYARYSLIAAVVSPGDERAIGRVVTHEVFHQIFHDRTANPFVSPAAWLDEGLAMSVQTAGLEGMDQIVDQALRDGTLLSLRSMISEWGSDRRSVSISYAASYSVVSFLISEFGEDALQAIVNAYSNSKSHEEALVAALGFGTDELDARWRAALMA